MILLIGTSLLASLAAIQYLKHGFVSPQNPQGTLLQVSQTVNGSISPILSSTTALEVCQNIYQFVCQNPGETIDPTGFVRPDIEGEKQAIHLYQSIIREHRGWSEEQVSEELVKEIFNSKRRARIESAYHWVQLTIEQLIDRQTNDVFKIEDKMKIKSQLLNTKLELPFPASTYADEPDLLTKNEAYYERLENGFRRLRVGGAYVLIAKSWFNLIFTLAHELAHSIDPCEIRAAGFDFPAYDRLGACFLRTGMISQKFAHTDCGPNDQLSETFADWVAVQVTVEALRSFTATRGIAQSTLPLREQLLNGARNSVRDLCEQEDDPFEFEFDPHPSPHTRITQIFGPPVQNFFGCTINHLSKIYCAFESPMTSLVKKDSL